MQQNLLTYLETITLPAGCSKRMDCPECGGVNTFSLKHDERGLVWHCFHAACDAHGSKSTRLHEKSFSDLIRPTEEPAVEVLEWMAHYHYTVSTEALEYIERNNCTEAFWKHDDLFAYDVKQNRVMFLVKEDGKVVDAAGRALDQRKPKWYRYGQSHVPFIVHSPDKSNTNTAVLVEDCASACAVFPKYSGVAILGTSLVRGHLEHLRQFEKVIVALDKDATDKSLDIAHKLGVEGIDNEIVFLEEDLKRNPGQV